VYICYTLLYNKYCCISEWKTLSELLKKVCNYFDSLALKHLGLYVNLLDPLVVYSQTFNLVYK
jgi:hypothetical protein